MSGPICPRCSERLSGVRGCDCPPCEVCHGSPSNAVHAQTSWVPLYLERRGIGPHVYVAAFVAPEEQEP
jgi:hypothetical protein